jgi:hypothetical protein
MDENWEAKRWVWMQSSSEPHFHSSTSGFFIGSGSVGTNLPPALSSSSIVHSVDLATTPTSDPVGNYRFVASSCITAPISAANLAFYPNGGWPF